MMRRLGAMSVAVVVVVLVSAAAGYAGARIGSKAIIDNSIQGRDVKNHTLKAIDLAAGAVATANVGASARNELLPRTAFIQSVPAVSLSAGSSGDFFSKSITLSAPRRISMVSNFGISPALSTDTFRVNCGYIVDATALQGDYLGKGNVNVAGNDPNMHSLVAVSSALAPGAHTIKLHCTNISPVNSVVLTNVNAVLTEVSSATL